MATNRLRISDCSACARRNTVYIQSNATTANSFKKSIISLRWSASSLLCNEFCMYTYNTVRMPHGVVIGCVQIACYGLPTWAFLRATQATARGAQILHGRCVVHE